MDMKKYVGVFFLQIKDKLKFVSKQLSFYAWISY